MWCIVARWRVRRMARLMECFKYLYTHTHTHKYALVRTRTHAPPNVHAFTDEHNKRITCNNIYVPSYCYCCSSRVRRKKCGATGHAVKNSGRNAAATACGGDDWKQNKSDRLCSYIIYWVQVNRRAMCAHAHCWPATLVLSVNIYIILCATRVGSIGGGGGDLSRVV